MAALEISALIIIVITTALSGTFIGYETARPTRGRVLVRKTNVNSNMALCTIIGLVLGMFIDLALINMVLQSH